MNIDALQQDIYIITNADDVVVVTTNSNEVGVVSGTMIYKGIWDASGGVLPTPAPLKGYVYRLNPGGTVPYLGGDVDLPTGTLIMALVNSPGQNMVNYTTW